MARSKVTPDWKNIEEVAALLETTLAPSAIVRHDVKLPVIGKPNRKPRQCDIVIDYGESPRQTRTIVEVQKRNRKPSITTFHGWVKKMQEVGAQHLICVSVKGFPPSIIDAVRTEYGPTVRLLTLEELERPQFSYFIFATPYIIHTTPHIHFESVGPVGLAQPSAGESTRLQPGEWITLQGPDMIHQKIFELSGKSDKLALTDLMNIYLDARDRELLRLGKIAPLTYSLEPDFGVDTWELWFCNGEDRYKIKKMPVKVNIENSVVQIPLTVFEYHQEFYDGILAWVVTAKGIVQNKDVKVRFVFRANEAGILYLHTFEQVGSEHLTLIVSPDEAVIRSFIDLHQSKPLSQNMKENAGMNPPHSV